MTEPTPADAWQWRADAEQLAELMGRRAAMPNPGYLTEEADQLLTRIGTLMSWTDANTARREFQAGLAADPSWNARYFDLRTSAWEQEMKRQGMLTQAQIDAAVEEPPYSGYEKHLIMWQDRWQAHHDLLDRDLEQTATEVEDTWRDNCELAESLDEPYQWSRRPMPPMPPLTPAGMDRDAEDRRRGSLTAFAYETELEIAELWRSCAQMTAHADVLTADLVDVRTARQAFEHQVETGVKPIVNDPNQLSLDDAITAGLARIEEAHADTDAVAWAEKTADQLEQRLRDRTASSQAADTADVEITVPRVPCDECGEQIHFVASPTGGWWSHESLGRAGHDGRTQVEVREEMDDHGYYRVVGVDFTKVDATASLTETATAPEAKAEAVFELQAGA